MKVKEFFNTLTEGGYDRGLEKLYGKEAVEAQRSRYQKAVEKFEATYPKNDEIMFFSASGRTEVVGNHTDHQRGCVLAAAVDVDVIGIASFNDSGIIHILSEGYDEVTVDCSDLSVHKGESGSAALLRGVVSKFAEKGVKVGGFDMYCTSDVLAGSGISSSAAYETLVGTLIDKYYNEGKLGAVEIAKIGQYAEHKYFDKMCGLMDQTVSAVGGFVFIDFEDTENPVIQSCSVDFDALGYDLFITDTKGSHANLSDEYSAVPAEMKSVAKIMGKEFLRHVKAEDFWANISEIRKECCDRAVLRAIHFLDENLRPGKAFDALKNNDIERFLEMVNQSGRSSEQLLQNIYSVKNPLEQAVNIGLAASRSVLDGQGAYRVHGGGFAGTIQAFVPKAKSEEYKKTLDRIFGEGSCRRMRIRPVGGIDFTEFAKEA